LRRRNGKFFINPGKDPLFDELVSKKYVTGGR